MTPERKQEIKETMINYLKEKFSTYPKLETPGEVLQKLPEIYKLLTEKELIDPKEIPPHIFQHIALDKWREEIIIAQLNSFF